MKISIKNEIAISILIISLSIIISFYIAYNTSHIGYTNLFLLPLLYGISYTVFIVPIRRKMNNIYIHVFIVVSFTRYVILSFLITFTGFYGGRSSVTPMDESFNRAINLMSYEMIVIFLFTYLLFRNMNLSAKTKNNEIKLPNSYLIYILFISTSILLALIFPESIRSFSFLKPANEFGSFVSNSPFVTLITYMLVVAKFLSFVLIMGFFYKGYKINKSFIYIISSFLLVALSISIYFGANRADYVITTIASILLFARLYPKFIKPLLIPLALIFVLTISSLNAERNHMAASEDPIVNFTNTLQLYLAGPYNVAIAIEAAELNTENREVVNVFHEILRPVIGLNIILKGFDVKSSSDYFNERIFFSEQRTQIVPMIGQGYFYFGFFLSPIILIFFIWFVRYLIIFQARQNQIEIIFFFSIAIARIGLGMAQNGSILANDTSFFLVLFLIVYFLNNKIVLKKKKILTSSKV